MRRRAASVLMVVALGLSSAGVANAGTEVPAGAVEGREHEVRIRSVLAELPGEKAKLRRSEREDGEAAITTCDPAQVTTLGKRVPTTTRDGDDPAGCVVVASSTNGDERLLLAPASLTGSELGAVALRRAPRKRRRVLVSLSARGAARWAFLGAALGDEPLAFTLDADTVAVVPIVDDRDTGGGVVITLGGRKGFEQRDAEALAALIEQAEAEEVIELGRTVMLTREARALYASTDPVIREKADFADDCPLPEAEETFVLGCYDSFSNKMFILRIDRPDLVGAMPVTAAHELLHAVYHGLPRARRTKIDAMIEEFLAASPQPKIVEEIALYDPSDWADELHSLVGTEVRDLPSALSRYYERYFEDREVLVTLFEGFEQIFDALETRFEQLEAELEALEAQLRSVEGQINAASAEADRLAAQIDSLRAQGRIDESNALVGPQNAAVDRANSLVGQYNSLVNQFNAKVAEINTIAESLGALYREVTPI